MQNICRRLAISLVMTLATSTFAADVDAKATFFINIYHSLCMKNINDFETLRAQLLKNHPTFPKEQAARFLSGMDGDAWPVTSSLGSFVISIPKGVKMCSVYARRANRDDVEKKFLDLVSTAPQPLVAEKRTDEMKDTSNNGKTHTVGFVWGVASATRKLAFILTTSSKDDADIQAYATATVVND